MINTSFRNHVSHLHEISEIEIYAYARSQFAGSEEEFANLAKQYTELAPEKKGTFLSTHGISVQDESLSLAISPEMGEFLYVLTLAKGASSVLELGSSNGVSTLYFAEALRTRGGGKVVATELETEKCIAIRSNIEALGLTDFLDLREGDVFETVKKIEGPFDIVFIDIWASGYLDIFKAIEPMLTSGTIIIADNMYTALEKIRPFKEYLRGMDNITTHTLAFESGVEFAVVL